MPCRLALVPMPMLVPILILVLILVLVLVLVLVLPLRWMSPVVEKGRWLPRLQGRRLPWRAVPAGPLALVAAIGCPGRRSGL